MLALLAMALAAAGIGAQTVDQAAIAQAIAAQQGGGAGATGTAPTVAPAQPVVGTLSAQAPGGAPAPGAAALSAADMGASASAIESMFAAQATALSGTGTATAMPLRQFGYSLFEKPTAPSLAAIGDDYALGPGDGLVLYLWGDPVDMKEVSASYTLTVDRQGFVFIQPIGQVSVLGQNLGQVRATIKGMLDRRYKRLEMSLSLSTLRQFPVFVSGYAGNPGTVLATGVDTVFTVLSRAGGVSKSGSLRSVRVKRGAETITLDFYDTLVSGSSTDLRVREGDSIYIPAIGPVSAVAGDVRRPGIYELKGETSVSQVLELAGAVLPSARSSGISRIAFGESGRSYASGSLADRAFMAGPARDGDLFHVGSSAAFLVGQAELSGPAKYPGRYDIKNYPTLGALLKAAQPLVETNLFYGRVYRMDSSGRDKSFAFSPRDMLAGAGGAAGGGDIALAEFDRIVLYRYDDAKIDPDFDRFPDTIVVSGPVKYPGFYLFREGATLSGLLADNALTLDASRVYAEIVSRDANGVERFATFSPAEVAAGADRVLSRLDRIRFVKKGEEVAAHDFNRFPDAAVLSGQVSRPDVFALGAGLKLSDLLTPDQILLDTNLGYAEILRVRPDGKNEYLTFRPAEVMEKKFDFALGPRDVIRLVKVGYDPAAPDFDRFSAAVQIRGPVQFQGLYAWREGMKLSSLLTLAKPALETNQVYAEIVRPLGGTKYEYRTFAPREVLAGSSDIVLKARDSVRLYTTVPAEAVVAKAAPAADTSVIGTAVAGTAEAADVSRFLEVVTISGTVRYAGPYARTATLSLSKVLTPDQILETTNLEYAEITRLTESGTPEYLTFVPREVLEGSFDLSLRARDSIRLVTATPFGGAAPAADAGKFAQAVRLGGRVARPEIFALGKGRKLSEILVKDQLLLDSNMNYAEITRAGADGKNEYFTFRPSDLLAGTWDFALGARDTVRILPVGYNPEIDYERFADAVQIRGPVQFQGLYAWSEGMKLSSLLALAKPALETNRVYAEIVRPLGGSKYEYRTFAPREVLAGLSDIVLKARDSVRLYTTVPAVGTARQAAEATPAEGTAPAGAAVAIAAAGATTAAAETAQVPAAEAAGPGAAGTTGLVSAIPEENLKQFFEVVTVSGAVRYAGPYARTATLTLSRVVTADQILENTNLEYAELTRLNPDGSETYLTFVPAEVLQGKFDLPLASRDSIRLVTKTGFKGARTPADPDRFADAVQLLGKVARPEIFALGKGRKLSQILSQEQILLDSNMNYAEITRAGADGKNEYFTFRPSEVLAGTWDFTLAARDVVRIQPAGYDPEIDFERFSDAVQIRGPVQFQGVYAWREGMKLSSLLALAKPRLETNQVYAEIVRPLGGTRFEYQTFAPREILSGSAEVVLKARDSVRLFTTAPSGLARQAAPGESPGATGDGGEIAGVSATASADAIPGSVTKAAPAAVAPATSTATATAPAATAPVAPAASAAAAPAATTAPAATATPAEVPAAPAAAGAAVGSAALATEAATAESADLSRFLEVVTISGAVRYAGPYARTRALSLSGVVTPDQILEDTNLEYAELVRLKEDGSLEYRTFSPRAVLEGRFDLGLRARDAIRLVRKTAFGASIEPSNFEKFSDVVQLIGQVARPEVFAWTKGMKLSQVLSPDQMLLGTNLEYAELVRFRSNGRNEYETFRPGEVLAGTFDMDLSPRDLIRIHKVNYSPDEPDFDRFANAVLVSGPMRFVGLYVWREGFSLAELQKKAQLLLEANQVYAEIVRSLPGGKAQIVTFAPREVGSGEFDVKLSARDVVRFYSTVQSVPEVRKISLRAEAGQTTPVAVPTSPMGTATPAAGETSVAVEAAAAPSAGAGLTTDLGFFLEVVHTQGTVRYAGPYARTPGLALSRVVTADQILQNTNLDYAELTRRTADGGWEYHTFAPRDVLSGAYDLPLRAQDSIRFVDVGYLPAKPDFDHYGDAFALTGRARNTGLYALDSTTTLSKLITSDQLLSDTDINYAEIERWVAGGRTEYLTFSPLAVLLGEMDKRIFPRDIVRLLPAATGTTVHDFTRYPETVVLSGLLRYPGKYAWYEGLTLSRLLTPDDLLIDTETGYAELKRRSASSETIVSFSPAEIVDGKKDLALSPRDTVVFYPKYYNKPVTISGEVAQPKVIPYYEGIELSVVLRSVTLSADLALLKAVVARADGTSSEIYLEDYLRRQANASLLLKPGDAVSIKRLLPDEHLPIVTVRGAVSAPQPVPFTDGMRLADALGAAGGYSGRAYPAGLVLIRRNAAELQQRQVDRLIAQLEAASASGAALPTAAGDSSNAGATIMSNLQIDIAMQRAKLGSLRQLYKEGFGRISLAIPSTLAELAASDANVVLERDDLVFVPTTPTYVLVSGEVSDQAVVAYRPGMTVRQAVEESGWLSAEADLSRTYIVRASGKLESVVGKGFWIFRPNIMKRTLNPGDTVVVPAKTLKLSVAWSYVKDSFSLIGTVLTTALTTKTLLGL